MTIPEQISSGIEAGIAKIRDAFKPVDLQNRIAELERLNSSQATDLTNLRASVTDLESKLKAKDGEITKLKSDHATELENKEKDVEIRAKAKAGQIVASQGIEIPVKDEVDSAKTGAGSGQKLGAQYAAMLDPVAKAQFYAKHREAILAGN
jgi:uncharacterized protein YlxW (UPF0749 family)